MSETITLSTQALRRAAEACDSAFTLYGPIRVTVDGPGREHYAELMQMLSPKAVIALLVLANEALDARAANIINHNRTKGETHMTATTKKKTVNKTTTKAPKKPAAKVAKKAPAKRAAKKG